jgi:hypothetical protein
MNIASHSHRDSGIPSDKSLAMCSWHWQAQILCERRRHNNNTKRANQRARAIIGQRCLRAARQRPGPPALGLLVPFAVHAIVTPTLVHVSCHLMNAGPKDLVCLCSRGLQWASSFCACIGHCLRDLHWCEWVLICSLR